VFQSALSETKVKASLEAKLNAYASKPIGVHIRNAPKMQVALGLNELYVHDGEGMAQSKLKISAAKTGTARNMNTV
jgi:hypothetical protein